MSSKKLKRIKGLRHLSDSVNSSGSPVSILPAMIPFGTLGFLVDMLSQLDLEEELKIGGNHWVEIELSLLGVSTIIREWYFSKSIPNDTTLDSLLADLNNECTYSLVTTIDEQYLDTYFEVGEEGDQVNVLGLLDTVPIITQDPYSTPIDIIKIELYKGNCNDVQNKPLWSKSITLNNNSLGLTLNIVETLSQEEWEELEGESE